MKRIFLFTFLTFALFSCSSDDDSSNEDQRKLIESGIWSYSEVIVLDVMQNSTPPKTNEELKNMANLKLEGLSLNFNDDGTAIVNIPDDPTVYSYGYTYDENKGTIEFEEGAKIGTLRYVRFYEDALKYIMYLDQTEEESGERLYYKIQVTLE